MRRRLVVAGVAALLVLAGGVGAAAVAAGTAQPVTCSYDGATLTCPVPQVTVTVTATTPTPSPSPTATTTAVTTTTAAPAAFPNATNTGVPAGTVLTAYTGSMTITANNTVIDSKTITGNLLIHATGVVVKRSKITGNVDNEQPYSVTVQDTEINSGVSDVAAVIQDNVTLLRDNIHGGRQSVTCGSNCNIQDTWMHGQVAANTSWHDNGYISNGGSNVLLQHNSIACEGANPVCTGPIAIFGDFSPLSNITINNNLILSTTQNGELVGAYCLYAGYDPGKPYGSNPTNVKVTGNQFQHGTGTQRPGTCAYYGNATSYLAGNGNVWSGNTYTDGAVIPAP